MFAKVWSLGRVMASRQTEIHSETPDGGGSIGAFVGWFISTSKRLRFFYYGMNQSQLQPF
jgi:hypothetical protein